MIKLPTNFLETPISYLENYGLSDTVLDTLDKRGYLYVKDFCGVTQEEMLGWWNFGPGSVENLVCALRSLLLQEGS